MKNGNGKEFNQNEAAKYLGVSKQTLMHWRRLGKIKCGKFRTGYRPSYIFTENDLKAIRQWMDGTRKAVP